MTTNINEEEIMKDIDFLELRNGKSFDEFFRRTKKEWEALAYKVLKSIDHPYWLDVEDITQFMAIQCMKAVEKWDGDKSPSIRTYVLWICMDAARKYVHHFRKSRGAKREGPARYDIPFSDLSEEHFNRVIGYNIVEPNQESRMQVDSFLKNGVNYKILKSIMKGEKPKLKGTGFANKKQFVKYAYSQVSGI